MWNVPQAFNWAWYRKSEYGKNGVDMPTEEELRSISMLLSDPSDDRMITVGVGGGSDGNLLPPLFPGMPSLWEAVQLGHEQSGAFGGRLILDEGG